MRFCLSLAALAVAAIVPLLTTPSAANDADFQDRVLSCAGIDDTTARLGCFDGLAATLGAIGEARVPSGATAWTVDIDTSPIDDSQHVVLSLVSTESTDWEAGITFTPKLTIACKENTTQISVLWHATIQKGEMTIRTDQETARAVHWDVADTYEETGLWSGHRSIPFIKSLFGHDRLVARIDPPYGQPEVTAIFPISGLDQTIAPLRRACGW